MAKPSQTIVNPSTMHITYTKKHLNGNRSRFAVQCETMEQVREIGYDLSARAGVSNIRINTCGRNLPDEVHTITYNEYKNQK